MAAPDGDYSQNSLAAICAYLDADTSFIEIDATALDAGDLQSLTLQQLCRRCLMENRRVLSWIHHIKM